MKLISDFIFVEGCAPQRSDSVLLQQVSRDERVVLMACVCDGVCEAAAEQGPGGYAAERLQEWYRKTAVELLMADGTESRIEKELRSCLNCTEEEIRHFSVKKGRSPEVSMTGILICGCCFWLFHKGDTRAYLLNQSFLRPHIRLLTPERPGTGDEAMIREGVLQRGVGILLCTDGLYGAVPQLHMQQCLNPQDIQQEKQIGKRLGELAQEARRQGGSDHISAVYIQC